MESAKFKTLFWLLFMSVIIELIQLVTKYFTLFYFNLFRLGFLVIMVAWMGYLLGFNRIFLVTFSLVALLLVILNYVVVWN